MKEQQNGKESKKMEERDEVQVADEEVPVVVAPTENAEQAPTATPEEKPEAEETPPSGGGAEEGATNPETGPEAETAVETTEENAWEMTEKRLEGLEGRLAEAESLLKGRMDSLQKAVSGFYAQTTDAMHHELEKYRKGLERKLEQELFGELIEIYDAAERGIARAVENPEKALGALEGIRDQVDAALFNRGVEKREATPGEVFDGRRHHATGAAVPTGDATLDGTVAATAKAGFDDVDERFKDLRGGCMRLRPIWVRLHKYDPSLAVPVETEPTESVESSGPSSDGKTDGVTPPPLPPEQA